MNTKIYEGFNIWISKKGYPCIWVDGKEIKLHVYIWEKTNGNKPGRHDIHHKDGDKLNYDLENLELVTYSEHKRIHAGWIKKNGEWIKKPCSGCNRILPLEDFYYVNTRKIESALCKVCHNEVITERNKRPENHEKLKTYKRNYYRSHYGKHRS
jgi:hypothetical protein